jgi:hypothetical protein
MFRGKIVRLERREERGGKEVYCTSLSVCLFLSLSFSLLGYVACQK